ncbi:MAG: hypothetical protein IH795_03575 [Bacteroidetes bacterium]|nr:hypothetical protein [Bacteroidota bacterium]
MKLIEKLIQALKEVYSVKIYFVLTIIFGTFIFLFNTLIINYKILFSNFSVKLLFSFILIITSITSKFKPQT